MSFPDTVREAEARAKQLGISVDELCRRAGVNRATWQRWKAGTVSATFATWGRVESVLAEASSNEMKQAG